MNKLIKLIQLFSNASFMISSNGQITVFVKSDVSTIKLMNKFAKKGSFGEVKVNRSVNDSDIVFVIAKGTSLGKFCRMLENFTDNEKEN